jgi:ABC-2 type transport system permease protein
LLIPAIFPFGFFASMGRGYLLPIAVAAFTLMMVNLSLVIGRGEYFPWAIPLIYAQGEIPLTSISYLILVFTGLAGLYATYLWWQRADQSR